MNQYELTIDENYCFDVAGYLHLPGVLNRVEINALKESIRQKGNSRGVLGWESPHCEPFRELLIHPTLVRYMNQICGFGFRLAREPELIGEAETKASEGRLSGGDEPRDPSRAYYFQNGRRQCQSVRAFWALTDIQSGDGGLSVVPCSHKGNVETPEEVLAGKGDLGLTRQFSMKAGDLLLVAGTLVQGLRPWKGNGPLVLLNYDYASRGAVLAGGMGAVAESDPDTAWRSELTPEQQAGIWERGFQKYDPPPTLIPDGDRCRLEKSRKRIHPGILKRDPDSGIDEMEFYFWDLCGYLVVRDVMSPEHLRLANEAIDKFQDNIVVGEQLGKDSKRLAGTGRPVLGGLNTLPEPYCDPFREMLSHPKVVHRLNWMGASGARTGGGSCFSAVKGTSGHRLHDANEPLIPSRSYVYKNGRSYCEAITVSWQLRDVTEADGGFACVPGSHKAYYQLPEGIKSVDADMGLVVHPVMNAGDVLFFMDGAQTHGALPWTSDIPRRAVLFKYDSRNFHRSGGEMTHPANQWGNLVDGMSDAQLAVMRGPDRDVNQSNVPRLLEEDGRITVSYEKGQGLYSSATPTEPLVM
ncbi:MAG: phytanoyl-CoA dioxygenase family protein [Planctomycetota bacterium]|nr:phytanoyl-CoA dioxygenase family protein [Planctomycetota bacterium]MDA1137803.1 phytanoyl-CoA dioxygenase family protein [Planctomycetota bacterium]